MHLCASDGKKPLLYTVRPLPRGVEAISEACNGKLGSVPVHTLRLIEEWHLLVVTYTEPFSGTDIADVARELGVPGSAVGEHLGILVDLRSVDVSKLSAADSQLSVSLRKEQLAGRPAEPLAYLLKDLREYGTIRMHNLWAEAIGLRKETDTFATESLRKALEFLEARTSQVGLANSVADGLG